MASYHPGCQRLYNLLKDRGINVTIIFSISHPNNRNNNQFFRKHTFTAFALTFDLTCIFLPLSLLQLDIFYLFSSIITFRTTHNDATLDSPDSNWFWNISIISKNEPDIKIFPASPLAGWVKDLYQISLSSSLNCRRKLQNKRAGLWRAEKL